MTCAGGDTEVPTRKVLRSIAIGVAGSILAMVVIVAGDSSTASIILGLAVVCAMLCVVFALTARDGYEAQRRKASELR